MQADTVAPTQSAPQVSQTQPINSGAPVAQTAAQAPTVATTPQWTAGAQPMAAPAPQVAAQMGVQGLQYSPTPSAYQGSQAPQAPQQQQAQAENPYRDAFDKVVNLLSSPVQFPFQGQQSTATQSGVQANYGSQATTQYSDPAAQTYMPSSASNQGYSNASSQTSTEVTADQLRENGVSEASLEVINHFGADAPALLNNYACQIEDSLIQSNGQLQEATGLLQELVAEHKAYQQILTNPDVLADYTCEFFGPKGPHPVQQAAPADGRFVGQQFQNTGGQQAPAPQRPEMPAPPQPQVQQGNPEEFWNSFGNLADRDPGQAWKYLNAAQQSPEIFRQKLLVME